MASGHPPQRRPTSAELIDIFGLEPLPVEGGLLVQTWRSDEVVGTDDVDAGDKRAGTAAIALLTDEPDSFSAVHRLPTTEVWHFYLGDPIQMLLLRPDGTVERPVLGPDVLAGQHVQVVVTPGTWMGARLAPCGGYGLFGCTMAPGFTSGDYEGGRAALASDYPDAAAEIETLIRPDAPTRMPSRP
ncbi:MAG: cupin domain-containing protein [Acidimicrobiia bacterium]